MDTIDDSTQGEREDLNYKDEIQGQNFLTDYNHRFWFEEKSTLLT